MSQDNFTFDRDGDRSGAKSGKGDAGCVSGCGVMCPLAAIPKSVWLGLLRQPFRKRHPFIFWFFMAIAIIIGIMAIKKALADDDPFAGAEKLALVSIQGAITDAGSTLDWIRKIERQDSIKGILVRVNSPGGGAAASQEIYAALARQAKRIPVVVSMGATAASGGLMISMAGARIYANPSTITGSIGVRMDIPQLQGLMSKIGVGRETLVTAPFKDAASFTQPLTPQDRAYLEGVLRDMHNQFVDIVAKGRHMPREKAAALANGKIFTGQEAMGLGLVDEMGGQDEAHEWLARKTGIPRDRPLAAKPSPKKRLIEDFLGLAKILGLFAGTGDDLAALPGQLSSPAFLYQF